MQLDDPDELCLNGSLILADPSLHDPNFNRTVLLLTNHSEEEGAHGYVLNRPLGKTVSDILPSSEFENLADTKIFVGGPVNTEQLTFTSMSWDSTKKCLHYDIHLSSEEALARKAEGFELRAFVGYSGWSSGQLESELKQKAWIRRPPDPRVLHTDGPEQMWSDLLRTMGPWYRLLADTPDDPTLN